MESKFKFDSLFESHFDVDLQYHMQIYTYTHIKYIKPFIKELLEK